MSCALQCTQRAVHSTVVHYLFCRFFKNQQTPLRVILFLFPALGWIRSKFPSLIPLADGDRFRGKTFEFFRKAIQEHKETITEGQPRDFIDAYLEEVRKTQDSSSSFYANSKDGGESI